MLMRLYVYDANDLCSTGYRQLQYVNKLYFFVMRGLFFTFVLNYHLLFICLFFSVLLLLKNNRVSNDGTVQSNNITVNFGVNQFVSC